MKALTKRHIRDGLVNDIRHNQILIELFTELLEDTGDERYHDTVIRLTEERNWLIEELKELIRE